MRFSSFQAHQQFIGISVDLIADVAFNSSLKQQAQAMPADLSALFL